MYLNIHEGLYSEFESHIPPFSNQLAFESFLKMAISKTRKTMKLEVLSYELLKAYDHEEIQKMIRVLSNEGLFFLDMEGPLAKDFLADLPPVLRHQRKFFEQTSEVKFKYHSGLYYKG